LVATCSYEARRYGVRSAMPISEAVRRLPPATVCARPRLASCADVSRSATCAAPTLERLRRHLGAGAGTALHLRARGIADDRVYPASRSKSISQEKTFAETLPASEDDRLDAALDAIRERFGDGYLQRGPKWRK
jgi:nucleotidyltransferase/DNA polymerase involved in DNA repair